MTHIFGYGGLLKTLIEGTTESKMPEVRELGKFEELSPKRTERRVVFSQFQCRQLHRHHMIVVIRVIFLA